jgi:hypothetical protein
MGVALVGSLFTSRLHHAFSNTVSATDALSPAHVQALSDADRIHYVGAFAHALAGAFIYVVPLSALAVVLACALRERPLRSEVRDESLLDAV